MKGVTKLLRWVLLFLLGGHADIVLAQCQGLDFSSSPLAHTCAPGIVNFTATGFTPGSAFTWKFGTTQVSGSDTISYIFTDKGIYDVEMVVQTPSSNVCTVTKTGFLIVHQPDSPVISVNKSLLCDGPDSVRFKNNTPGYSRVDWIVDANNLTNKGDSFTYQFIFPGIKNVGVRAFDTYGCSVFKNFDSVVRVYYPLGINVIPSTTSGCKPLKVNYSANITPASRAITQYSWQFQGASPATSTVASPQNITYTTAGIYNVTLTVKTADGCTYTKVTTFQIDAVDTTPPPFFTTDTMFCQGGYVKLRNTADRSIYPGTFWWDLGPSGVSMITDTLQLGADTILAMYFDAGKFTVDLHYSYKGCSIVNHKVNYINSIEAVNGFKSDNNFSCIVPATVDFINTSQVLAGKTFTYVFYKADGKTVMDSTHDINPSITYTEEGEYNVQLITRSPGCNQNIMFAKYVRIKQPDAKMTYTGEICLEELLIMNDATARFTNDTIHYKWYIWNRDSTAVLYYSDSEVVKYNFKDTGYYDVTFIVYSDLCSDTLRKDSAIHVYRIIAGLKNFAPFYCTGAQIFVKGAQNPTPPNLITSHDMLIWHQTDSLLSNASGHNVDFLGVTQPGLYNIRYIASNNGMCADTVVKKGEIKISAADMEVIIDKPYGCLPYTATFRAKALYNYHFSKPQDSTLKYRWEIRRQDSLVLDTTILKYTITDSVCHITVFKPDIYDVGLRVTNSDNCNKYVYYPRVLNLMHWADANLPPDACKGTILTAKNNSIGTYERFKWILDKPLIKFQPSDSAFEPEMIFLDSGRVRVVLEAYDSAGCVDRDTAFITITQLDVSFATQDTFKKCAPAVVNFISDAPLGTYFRWSFGDGDTLETYGKDIFHIYRTNSGSATDGFDVYLYGQSPTGCVSEVLKTDYVKVVGPVPKFSILDHSGCEPYAVHFVNQSQNLKGLYFDFGDGSPIDTTGFTGAHTYVLKNPALLQDVFRPKLVAYDKELCYSVYQSPDSIVVYRKPEAGFIIDKAVVCAGEQVTLRDTTQLAVKHFWDFDANGNTDDTLQVTTPLLAPGYHDIQLRVISANGCADTVMYPAFAKVNPIPVASFVPSDTAFCLNKTVGFFNSTPGANKLKSFSWDFGDNVPDDTSSARSPYYHYQSLGFKTISMIAVDSNDCTDTIIKPNAVEVIDTSITIQPVMDLVTVAANNSVYIQWDSVTIRKFKNYNLYRSINGSGNWQSIYQPQLSTDTTYTDYSYLAKDTSVAYRVSVSNQCGVESKPSALHATVFAHAGSSKHSVIHIDWNPYVGWPVKEYHLFAAVNPRVNPYTRIAVLQQPGYNDSNLCAIEKFYYVQAISASDTTVSSFSNITSHIAVYDPPAYAPVLSRVTVEKDRQVLLTWSDQNQKKWKGIYSIDRYDTTAGWKSPLDSTHQFSYTDQKADVHAEEYIYRVRFTDTCSLQAPESNIGTNILLKARIKNDEPYLTWSPYKDWPTGVDHYLIQINRNGQYHTLRKVNGDTTFFTDHDLHPAIDSLWIYRVIGVSKWFADTSVSNTATATPFSRMWIPNAFTPNEDGLNDIWMPVAVGVYNEADHNSLQYELRIFDRWGTEVFRSENLYIGWNGNFNGATCPDGVYTYSIRAAGMSDRQKFNKSGTITLMR